MTSNPNTILKYKVKYSESWELSIISLIRGRKFSAQILFGLPPTILMVSHKTLQNEILWVSIIESVIDAQCIELT